MDVTSLLNSSSAALQRRDSIDSSTPSATGATTASSTAIHTPSPERTPSRRTSGSGSPSRNRTPWDANGYSLPLTLDTKSIQNPSTTRQAYYSESPTDCQRSDSPKSNNHKFSDSRSSLSSYTGTSSSNSVAHSRISSLSTVSEFQPLATLFTDITLEPRTVAEKMETGGAFNSNISRTHSHHVHAPSFVGPDKSSPTPIRRTLDDSASSEGGISPTELVPPRRPGSPSDAVIIRRGPSISGSPPNLKTGFNSSLSADSSPSRAHKRAVSAPDFQGMTTLAPFSQSFATIPDQAPMSSQSHYNSHPQPYSMDESPAPSGSDEELTDMPSPPSTSAIERELQSQKIHCMHIDNCDTQAPYRKAISHIFGRNKLCTRSIPDFVWVHYCRKHYQRSRYRSPHAYALAQCRLVLDTIRRVQTWSDMNQRDGNPGILRDWTLAIRKREQKRLEEAAHKKRLAAPSKKRRLSDDDDDEYEDDPATVNRAWNNGTAVPQWLLDRCGDGYSTEEITSIAEQLKSAVLSNELPQIPDIEILPNISNEDVDGAKARTYARRKMNNGGHKRSQSMGGPDRVEQHRPAPPLNRRVSQPNVSSYGDEYSPPLERRHRAGDDEYYTDRPTLPSMPPRSADRVVPTMTRRVPLIGHRPTFENIRENQSENDYYGDRYNTIATSASSYGQHLVPATGPLPAPIPQGLAPPATHLDNTQQMSTGFDDYRPRPSHARSNSEFTFNGGLPYPASTAAPYSNGYGTGLSSNYTTAGYPPMTQSGYPPASTAAYTPGYVKTESAAYTPGYLKTESGYNTTTSSMSNGMNAYYDGYAPRQQQYQQQPYSSSYASHSPYYQTAGEQHGMGYGGGAKHMRHQSTPVVPRALEPLPTPPLQYEGTSSSTASSLPAVSAPYQPHHMRSQTSSSYVPSPQLSGVGRIQEADMHGNH